MAMDRHHAGRLRAVSNQLFAGPDRVRLRGACFTPLEPIHSGEEWTGGFGREAETLSLLLQAQAMGLNALRVYLPPPKWFLDCCAELGFFIFVDLSWNSQSDFLSTTTARQRIEHSVLTRLRGLGKHEAVAGIFIGNELPADLVRWHGAKRCSGFLDDLIRKAREEWEEPLYGYAGYPPSDSVAPNEADFCALNLYPKDREALRHFLQRAMQWAGERPFIVSEVGEDVRSQGEKAQAEMLMAISKEAERAGNAGFFWFSLTDRWWRSGRRVEGWEFGLLDHNGRPRPASALLQASVDAAESSPSVTVVVCVRDGARSIEACLSALLRMTYSNLEVLVIDDGSRDETPALVESFARRDGRMRLVRQEPLGLSAARNRGVSEAKGEIVAFTDADCCVDPGWASQLVMRFKEGPWAGVGGFNLSPDPVNWQQACVASAPGGAWHVMLDDEEAEHLPGCNMAFRKEVFEQVGGFEPLFKTAG
ncbi:MAG: glycosyltransferase, partial [Verrucomicrobiia bacterium]